MYSILTDANFRREVLESSECVLVEITTDWSGASHIMAPILEELETRYRGRLKVAKLDSEGNATMTAQYGVREIPALLLFRRGEFVGRLTGVISGRELEAQIDAKLLGDQRPGARNSDVHS